MKFTSAASLLALCLGVTQAIGVSEQSATAPRFEVASIKPCKPVDLGPGARSGSKGPSPSPGRLHMECVPLVGPNGLIRRAYGAFASGERNAFPHASALPVEGGPEWTTREYFTVDAKAEGTPSVEMMLGPMLQSLLEDRFRLKVRRETRQVPVYELTVAKGGPKLKPFNSHCTPVDFSKGSILAQLEADGACPISVHDDVIEAPGETISDFITFALTMLDRPVIDKTGLSGRFDIHLDLPGDDGAPLDLTSKIASVLPKQIGLRLESAKGPGDVLLIEHVERLRPDGPAEIAMAGVRASERARR